MSPQIIDGCATVARLFWKRATDLPDATVAATIIPVIVASSSPHMRSMKTAIQGTPGWK